MMFHKTVFAVTTIALIIGGLTACDRSKQVENPQDLVTGFNNTWANADEFKGEVKVKSIQKTDSDKFYLVEMENGGSGYLTADGKNLIGGPVLQLEGNKIVELGEKIKTEKIKEQLKKIDLTTALTYKPTTEPKHTLYVFTDPTCSACASLHSETEELLNNGIQIHYLAWSRGPDSMKAINDVWCAKDKKAAYQSAINSVKFETEKCESKVEKNIEVGKLLNVKATPTIFTEDGRMISGAVPANIILSFLDTEKDTKKETQAASEVKLTESKSK